jgi:hypothetical protein
LLLGVRSRGRMERDRNTDGHGVRGETGKE